MNAKRAKRKSSARGRGESAPTSSGRGRDEIGRIRELLELMEEHGLVELEIGPDAKSLRLSKAASMVPMAPAPAAMPAPAAAAAPAPAAGEAAPEAAMAAGTEQFLSPMVGTFYRAASPEQASYVAEGDAIQPDSTLCIIEAMKVFNEIKAETSGTVLEILVENGEAVEYGQPLFLIKKAS